MLPLGGCFFVSIILYIIYYNISLQIVYSTNNIFEKRIQNKNLVRYLP